MSRKGNLTIVLPYYKLRTIEMLKAPHERVFGLKSMGKIAGVDIVHMTQDVNLDVSGNGLGQQYASTEYIVRT